MTILEEMAKAAYEDSTRRYAAAHPLPDELEFLCADDFHFGKQSSDVQQHWSLALRAALVPAQIPTTEMLIAGADQISSRLALTEQDRRDLARDIWQAMLAEAVR